MVIMPTYEESEQRVKELENEDLTQGSKLEQHRK